MDWTCEIWVKEISQLAIAIIWVDVQEMGQGQNDLSKQIYMYGTIFDEK